MSAKRFLVRVLAVAAVLGTASGFARADVRHELQPYRFQKVGDHGYVLDREQRQQMRQQMREHWQQMPPEQRDARRQDYRERWQQVPSGERQRMREEMREQRGGDGRFWGPGARR